MSMTIGLSMEMRLSIITYSGFQPPSLTPKVFEFVLA